MQSIKIPGDENPDTCTSSSALQGRITRAKKGKHSPVSAYTAASAKNRGVSIPRTKSGPTSRSTEKNKSRENLVRRGRSSKKEDRKKAHRKGSDGSSVSSSTEKDPAQHAAFLQQYFEESTRLAADTKSSMEVIVGSEAPASLPGVVSSSETRQSRRSSASMGSSSIPRTLSQRLSKASVTTSSRKSVQLPESPLQPTVKALSSGSEGLRESKEGLFDLPRVMKNFSQVKSIERRVDSGQNRARASLTRTSLPGKNYYSSNVSTTAVAGSPKSRSPVNREGNGVSPAEQGIFLKVT